MLHLHYWTSLLVFFLFLTISPKTNMKNTANQELMDSAKNIVQKIKAIQEHCKENKLDLKTFLSEKEYKDYQTSLVFIKKYLPEIKVDAFSLKQESKNETDPTKDIEKTPFVEALIKWKELIKGIFSDLSKEYKEVQVNPSIFGEALGSSTLPIVNSLLTDWKTLIKSLPEDSTTLTVLFAELLKSNTLQSFTVANEKELLKVYKKAQGKYKELENDIKKFQTDVLPNKALFIAAIKASTAPDDKNLPDNLKVKAEADKAKAGAYQDVLDAWKAEEVANLSYESGDDTIYIDMSLINTGDPSVRVHNLPIELKANLLTTILNEAKKAGSRRQSVKNLKNIAIGAVTVFHTQNLHKKENYQALTLEKIEAIKFPTNISGWILNYLATNKETDPKIKAYKAVLDTWYSETQDSLNSTNASEDILIDPASLDISSGLVDFAGIPASMSKELLSEIKSELSKYEKETGALNFNAASALALKPINRFSNKYNIDNTTFDYKSFSLEDIRKFKLPTGIHQWIKEAEAPGVKKDIKKDIKAQLDITLKNTNNFNLEALIKELKIELGGITINNDFNFDNDMHLTYNSLDLILKELIKINKKTEKAEDKKERPKKTTSNLLIEGFSVSYLFNTYFAADLNLGINLTKDSESAYTFKVDSLELKNKSANILKLDELNFKSTSVSIPKGATKTLRIGFSITYNYNLGQTTIKMVNGGYQVVKKGGEVGIKAGTPFVQGWAKLNYSQTDVGDSKILGISEGSHDMTFTDHYVFELEIENKEAFLDIKSKNVSFANKKYTSICYEEGEKINLSQNIKTVK